MMANQIFFQWQNPKLRETIYPFRMQKLRDFLLYYKEIDLMKTVGKQPVDPATAQAILQARSRSQQALDAANQQKTNAAAQIKQINQQHRELLSSSEVRKLQFAIVNQRNKLTGIDARLRTMKNRRDWYQANAPDHPYFVKFDTEYQTFLPVQQEAQQELKSLESQLAAKLGPVEKQISDLEAKVEQSKSAVQEHTARLKELPAPDAQGKISPRAAVRWQMLAYQQELEALDHDRLLEAVVQRFFDEPGRFPRWLEYMVVHFSGMRYKSAHGSWADPRDLLESLEVEHVNQKLGKLPPPQLEALSKQAVAELTRQKATADERAARQLDIQIQKLQNPFARLRVLQALQGEQAIEDVDKLSDGQVLERLKSYKSQFPEWAWKEIVAHTNLRLDEVQTTDWETLTPQEQQARWDYNNRHWREMLDAWITKDITSWRAEHERTLELIVTRAVCNEIAEHIQHLRGLDPAGGLTAKPTVYLRAQDAQPGQAFFRSPASPQDFKSGGSILFLGWVRKQPNAWQIAHPLPGIDLVAVPEKKDKKRNAAVPSEDWRYQLSGNVYVRTARTMTPKPVPGNKKGKTKMVPTNLTEWLRWTHEAIVVEVAEMIDGWYVLTFETGQIGLNRRPLNWLANTWDVYVGYMPEGRVDRQKLDEMLDWKEIVPGLKIPTVPLVPAQPFDIMGAPQDMFFAGVRERWETLTPRQKQVVAHFCAGLSVREIATLLDTSTSTIYTHISNAVKKLELGERAELCPALAGVDLTPWQVKSLRKQKNKRGAGK
jgi:DNA-binding CsgD family transcriptional regulator